jgi:phospholipid transport system substrate-binding protein
VISTIFTKTVGGRGVTLSFVSLMWVCLALGVEAPTVVVKNTIDEVIQLVTDEKLKVPDQVSHRRRLLEETIGKNFDFEEMAKRSLAVHWKSRNASEHREFVTLFQKLLSNTYAGKIENYSGETVNYRKERLKDGYAEVQTNMDSAKTEISLDYRLILKGSHWRVYDVVVNGVSLVKNYRSQFDRIIHRSSYEDLVTTLREKSNEITAP